MSRVLSMLAWAALVCTANVLAAEPSLSQFAVRVDVTVPGAGPFFRVPVPADVYQYAQTADLADLRVFNAQGEAVPFAYAYPGASVPTETATDVAVYPIRASVHQAALAGHRMEIRTKGGATAIVIEKALVQKGDIIAAYLLDARAIKGKAVALELDAEFDPARLVPVTLEASRDLKAWRTVARGEPVFRLESVEAAQVRTRVRIAPAIAIEDDYLRLTWTGSSKFELRGAKLGTIPTEAPPRPAAVEVLLGAPVAANAKEIEWSLPTRASLSRLSIHLAETNALTPVTVLGRRRAGEPWVAVGRTVAYRLRTEDADRISPPFDIAPASYQALRIVAESGFGANAPVPAATLTLHFAPLEIVFLARGNAPFVLGSGNGDAQRAALPLASLLPGYKTGAERTLPTATHGRVHIDPQLSAEPKRIAFGIDTRTAALWAVLIGAVLLLSVFALSLLRKVNVARSVQPPPS